MCRSPFFSIIIPTYNRAHTIRRPIDSIIAQTFTDLELVIVDDGSTDDTKSIVDSYRDARIRYVWQENQERSVARNHGIKLAKGEWICFQDSDDEYSPVHLQVLYDGIKKHPDYKIVRTGLLIYQNEKYIGKSGTQPAHRYDQHPYNCIHIHCFLSEVVKEYTFKNEFITVEDFYFLFRILNAYNVLHLSQYWTGIHYYDPASSGGVGSRYEKNLMSRITCMDYIISNESKIVTPYVYRQRCLSEILLLAGHIKYQPQKIFKSIIRNFSCFYCLPKEYLLSIYRMIYVKAGEWTGLNRTNYRF